MTATDQQTPGSSTLRPNPVYPLLPPCLYVFEGKDVVSIQAQLTKTGDGLSQSMQTDQVVHQQGSRAVQVIESELTKVQHRPYKHKGVDTGALERLETWEGSGTVAIVEPSSAISKILRDQKQRNEKAAEDRAGIQRLFEEQQQLAAEAQAEADEQADDAD